jgi:WD40 repeat protein
LKNEELVVSLDHGKPIESIVKDPKNDNILLTSGGDYIKIWDLSKNECLETLYTHSSTITKLQFTKNGERLLSCSLDNTLKFYDCKDYSIEHTIKFDKGLLSFAISVK